MQGGIRGPPSNPLWTRVWLQAPLTSQRFHMQLRLLRVYVILYNRVDVCKDKPHRTHRGPKLPQRVRSRFFGLGAKQGTCKADTFYVTSPEGKDGCPLTQMLPVLPVAPSWVCTYT